MNLEELRAQQEALKKQIDEMVEAEKPAKIAEVKKIIADYNLQPGDIFDIPLGIAAKAIGNSSGASKKIYRHPKNEALTYGGRGPLPAWLKAEIDAGKSKEDFLEK